MPPSVPSAVCAFKSSMRCERPACQCERGTASGPESRNERWNRILQCFPGDFSTAARKSTSFYCGEGLHHTMGGRCQGMGFSVSSTTELAFGASFPCDRPSQCTCQSQNSEVCSCRSLILRLQLLQLLLRVLHASRPSSAFLPCSLEATDRSQVEGGCFLGKGHWSIHRPHG